jgi:hypothetical protein
MTAFGVKSGKADEARPTAFGLKWEVVRAGASLTVCMVMKGYFPGLDIPEQRRGLPPSGSY